MSDFTLFDMPTSNPKHPAKYTDSLLGEFVSMMKGCNCILDPFGGTGKIFLLNKWFPEMEIQAVEIEKEWARINKRTIVADATLLPYSNNYFDGICTSPTYGNRMADGLIDKSERITYASKIGRKLHENNSGSMQWGKNYKHFHVRAWKESTRVLKIGGILVLNIKNHIRSGEEQLVTEWHIETLISIGYKIVKHSKIKTPSMKFGKNSDKRLDYESVIKFQLVDKITNV